MPRHIRGQPWIERWWLNVREPPQRQARNQQKTRAQRPRNGGQTADRGGIHATKKAGTSGLLCKWEVGVGGKL
jgi:hypothetical protein